MTAYAARPFKDRFHVMGDIAEDIYLQVKPFGRTERWGWRRPKNVGMKHMPTNFRHKPDFYVDAGFLVEVMGLGKDGVLKSVKPEKWEAIKEWRKFCVRSNSELMFFIWNSFEEEYVTLSYPQLLPLVAKAKRRGPEKFNDGNEYYPIKWEDLKAAAAWVGKWTAE